MFEMLLTKIVPLLGLDPELIRGQIDRGMKIAEEYNARLARIENALNLPPIEKENPDA